MNLQSIYYLRTNNELIMDLKFLGCEQQLRNLNMSNIILNDTHFKINIIPSEYYGNYLIFLSNKISKMSHIFSI